MGVAKRLVGLVEAADAKVAAFLRPVGRRVAAAAVLALALAVLGAACGLMGSIDDDWTIALMLNPRYEASGELCLFVNAALSRLIRGLNEALPAVNWFFALELGCAALALGGLLFALLSYAPLCLALFLAGCAAVLVLPGCTYASNFTYVAALASLAGGSLLLGGALAPRRSVAATVLGVCLCVVGFCWRAEAFALSVPFFALGAAGPCLRAGRFSWKAAAAGVAPYLAVAAAVGCLALYDAQAWSVSPWSDWRRFNDARSALSDYPMPPYEEVARELEELGVSENDYYLMTHWAVDDAEVFSVQTLEQVAELGKRRSSDGWLANVGRHFSHSKMAACFVACAALVLTVCRRARHPLRAVLLVGLGCAALAYFAAAGRLPDRVERPICLYALVSAVLAAGPFRGLPQAGDGGDFSGDGTPACVSGVAAFVAGCALLLGCSLWLGVHADGRALALSVGLDGGGAQPGSVAARLEEKGGDLVYVWDAKAYGFFERSYRFKGVPSRWAAEHNPALGGWDVQSPGYLRRGQRLGSGLLDLLAANPNARLVTCNPVFADRVLGFLREHCDARLVLVDEGPLLSDGPGGLHAYAFREQAPRGAHKGNR